MPDNTSPLVSLQKPENRPPGAPNPSPAPAQYNEDQKQKCALANAASTP